MNVTTYLPKPSTALRHPSPPKHQEVVGFKELKTYVKADVVVVAAAAKAAVTAKVVVNFMMRASG